MSAGSLARALRKLTILHGGKDFETPDPQFLGAGEPGGIRPLGNGLYGYAVRSPEDVDNALHQARKYAKNYGGSTPTLHAFELEVGPGEVSSNAKWARELDTPEMKQVSSLYRLANSLPVGEERSRAFAQAHEAAKILPENDHKLAPISTEELPIGLEEVAVKDLSRLLRKGKWSADTDPALIRKELFPDSEGSADPDLLSAMNAGTYLGSNLPEGTPTGQEPGAKDYLTMLLRGTVQGTAADALSGLYGLAHGGDVQKIQEAQDVLGYKPEGAEAQAASNLGELLAPIMEPISNAVDWVGDRSPIAGAVLQSAPVVAGLPAALRAGRTVNRAANRVLAEELRHPSGAKSAQRGHFRYFDYTNEPSESRAAARSALKELDDNGVPAAEVWKQYGWGREPVTNRPITEVSDSRLDVPSNKLYRGPDGGTLLFGARKGDTGEHLLKDSILQGEAYLKYLDPNYKIRGNPQKNLGSATHYAPFATESGLIEMGPQASYADFMDVLVHELNHGMQSRFGAPRGGSPEQFGYKDFETKYFDADEEYRNHIESLMDKLPAPVRDEITAPVRAGISSGNVTPEILGRRDSQIIQNAGRLPPDPEIQRILIESLRAMEQKKLFKSEMRGARKKYENLHGEAMSRLAQNRRNLSPQQNGAIYPFEPTYFKQQTGTDIGDLDVRF